MVSDRVALFIFILFYFSVSFFHWYISPMFLPNQHPFLPMHTHTMYLLAMVRQSSVISRRMTGLSRILRSNDTDCLQVPTTLLYQLRGAALYLVCISHNHHHLLPLPLLLLLLLLLLLILFVPFFAYRRHLYRRRLQPRTLWVDHNHAPPQDTSRIDRALHSCILL